MHASHLRALPLTLLLLLACGDDTQPTPLADAGPDQPDAALPLDCLSPDTEYSWPAPQELSVTASDSWSADIAKDSPFLTGNVSEGLSPILWAKWSVLLEDRDPTYFQDSRKYPFHYDFASKDLDPFADISRADFDAITLHSEGRRVALGAVLFPTRTTRSEYGIQIVGTDPLHPKLVKALFEQVASAVQLEGHQPVYVPAASQVACAEFHRDWYTQEGIELGSVDAWLPGDQCYSEGWSMGRVVQLAASEVESAALDGSLAPDDILLLEGSAPAELPAIAGLLTLEPSTPNSHTAILAQSYGIPFAYLRQEESQARALELSGKLIALGASSGFGGYCRVRLFDLREVENNIIDMLREMSRLDPLSYPAKALHGSFTTGADQLRPIDINTVGGKAAH